MTFIATPRADNDAMADLVAESADGVTGTTFCAIHPEGIALSATSVALPAVQESADGGTNITTLRLTTPVTLTGQGEHDFYMYLPENAAGYQGMEITFYQPDGACCTKAAPASTGIVVERSKYTPISFNGDFAFLNPDQLARHLFGQ